MPTKYAEVQGCATYYYYAGADHAARRGARLFARPQNHHGAWRGLQRPYLAPSGRPSGRANSPIAIDLPAHGRSSGVEGLKTVREYSDFVVAFLDALGIGSAVIVGRSMGGAVAMDFAMRYPKRVEAMLPMASAAKFNIEPKRIDALRGVAMGRAPQAFVTYGYSPATVKDRFEIVREGWMEQIQTDPRVRYTDMVACTQCDLREQIGGSTSRRSCWPAPTIRSPRRRRRTYPRRHPRLEACA